MPLSQPYADNNSEFYAYKLGASGTSRPSAARYPTPSAPTPKSSAWFAPSPAGS